MTDRDGSHVITEPCNRCGSPARTACDAANRITEEPVCPRCERDEERQSILARSRRRPLTPAEANRLTVLFELDCEDDDEEDDPE